MEQPTSSEPRPILQLVGVRKTFNGFAAVDRIDLDVREGEFLTIVGPSGSGKTTLLRMLAGMESPSEGNITLRGELINEIPSNKRPTCLVFQSLALFPHKTVGENIAFPLKVKGVDPATRKARALDLMKVVRLPADYHDKNVMKCSGGERQRVALARALAYDPEVLFFDEPLSAIDYKLKKTLEKELKDLHRETGKTFIYITHSLEEAMVMSDRIGVMRSGRLVQVGTPEEIYGAPVDRFVSEFVGEVNTIKVKRNGADLWAGIDVPGSFKLRPPQQGTVGDEAFVVVRPEYMRFVGAGENADNTLKGTVYNEYSLGSRIQYQVRVGDKVMLVELSRARALPPGSNADVTVGWDAADAFTLAS
ncbi:Spermidine/putrescine import ATP-binding protein PotA [Hartmannibacter diazotrophicus]|uniref:Spermidine/putrescine import ATP-binding protein PotA n=1 Tax=Hartmannibacter diazotrophicus TaxID=1482074 RepID=A0A2C9DCD7_9HYPH|nr:ABC transporter ATP-binding protein [Hartmannibacter diazotrophicus]SON57967.1 Spermidine/putrescine import ATP-binding protein PotA [Hartmannibacter diazotrophicus]